MAIRDNLKANLDVSLAGSNVSVSSELPYSVGGETLYNKNMKYLYIDEDNIEVTELISCLDNNDVNQTETKNLNANDKQNSDNNIKALDSNFDNTDSIRKIIETIKSDQVYQLQTINNGEVLETKVPETLIGNFEKTKLVLKDGSAIPDWVEFDPVTGEISVNLPDDIDKLEFKLIVESDGKIIVSDLEIDVRGDEVTQNLDDIENTRFIAFKDQLNKEHDNWEEYGSNIINRL